MILIARPYFLSFSKGDHFFHWLVFTSWFTCLKLFYNYIQLIFPYDFFSLVGTRNVWIDTSFTNHCIIYNLNLGKLIGSSITFIMRIHVVWHKCCDPNLWWVWNILYYVGWCKMGDWFNQHDSNQLLYHSTCGYLLYHI